MLPANDCNSFLPMTLKQASQEYFRGKIGYNKLRAMAKAGELPVKLVGGRYFTRRDWLDKWFGEAPEKIPPETKVETKSFGPLRVLG